jgi:hypothetical protein
MHQDSNDEFKEKNSDPDLVSLQHVNEMVKFLPNFSKIKTNAFQAFDEIKRNLYESLAINEYRPGFAHWTNALNIFIWEYGLFFTKDDHIKLIKLYIEVMITPNIDFPIIIICLEILEKLLK